MGDEYDQRLSNYRPYGNPPSSVKIISTDDYLNESGFSFSTDSLEPISSRPESLIYTMRMTTGLNERGVPKFKRQDPYTGTQFMYDYIWCRNGPHPDHKARNLILNFPLVPKEEWNIHNPNDPTGKTCNWYLTANGMVFQDGCLLIRE